MARDRRRGGVRTSGRRKLIVAYDGSKAARRALAHTAELVGRRGTVTVVNVIPSQGVRGRLHTIGVAEQSRQQRLLDDAGKALAQRGVETETIAAVGDPAAQIIAAADEIGATVIVVGRRQRRRPDLRGSLTARLIRSANRDIFIVNYNGREEGSG